MVVHGCNVFRLNQLVVDGLIEHHGLTWKMIENYLACHSQLFVGPIFLTPSLSNCPYPYIISFDNISLCMAEEPRQADGSDPFQTAFQTLMKLYSSHDKYPAKHFVLQQPTQHQWIFHKFNIPLSLVRLSAVLPDNNIDVVKWSVENIHILKVSPAKLSSEAWGAFCKILTGPTSKVKELTINTDTRTNALGSRQSLSPGLVETIKKASTVETLHLEVYGSSSDLEPFLDKRFKNDHIFHLKVTGGLQKEAWFPSLSSIIKMHQYTSIEYSLEICGGDEYGRIVDMLDFSGDERERIVNMVHQAKSLINLSWHKDVSFGPEFHKQRIEPIFKERKFKKRALEIAPTLKSNNKGIVLLERLSCHRYVRPDANTMFGILRGNIAPLEALWDAGRDNRINLLKQIIIRSAHTLEAAVASKKRKFAH